MRTAGSKRDTTWPVIREAGIKLICAYGYDKTNIRLLAREAGLQPGSLYNYFNSKEDFLSMIVCEIMEDLLRLITQALEECRGPVERVKMFTHVMALWHAQHRKEALVAHLEVRSVSKERYEEYADLRRAFGKILTEIIQDGVNRGDFEVVDVQITCLAILTMLASIPTWYREKGRLTGEELAAQYTYLTLSLLNSKKSVLNSTAAIATVGKSAAAPIQRGPTRVRAAHFRATSKKLSS